MFEMRKTTARVLSENGLDPDRHAVVYKHHDFDICTLREAVPSQGDFLGYVVCDDFNGIRKYNTVGEAIDDIDAALEELKDK